MLCVLKTPEIRWLPMSGTGENKRTFYPASYIFNNRNSKTKPLLILLYNFGLSLHLLIYYLKNIFQLLHVNNHEQKDI